MPFAKSVVATTIQLIVNKNDLFLLQTPTRQRFTIDFGKTNLQVLQRIIIRPTLGTSGSANMDYVQQLWGPISKETTCTRIYFILTDC